MGIQILYTDTYVVSYTCKCDITIKIDNTPLDAHVPNVLALVVGFEMPECPMCGTDPTVVPQNGGY